MHPYEVAGGIRMPPETVGDSLALFGAEARLQALDVETGEVVWKSASVSPTTLEIKGLDLLIGDETGYVAHVLQVDAWNLRDGSRRWTFDRPPDTGLYDLGYFALGPDHIFLFGNGSELLRVDRRTGERVDVWNYAAPIAGARYRNGYLYLGQALTPEGAEGQDEGALTKVNAATGDTIWTFETKQGGFWDMRPIVGEDRVFAGTHEGAGAFFAVDRETGEEIWRNRQGYTFAADHSEEHVYLNTSAELMAISKETGQTVWLTDMPGGSGFGGVEYHDGYLYHPRGGALVVVDAEDGTIVHEEPSPSGYFWTVHAGAGQIFAQSSGHLIAYEPYQP
jgi:outer membrane protein assembly factor BamB